MMLLHSFQLGTEKQLLKYLFISRGVETEIRYGHPREDKSEILLLETKVSATKQKWEKRTVTAKNTVE
jgi:hypothetical protein